MKTRSVPKQWAICLVVSMNLLAFGAQDSAGLPFDDKRDFDEAGKGFIAEPDSWKVVGPEGNVVWDLARYDFFRTDRDFPSVHPSLQRVSRLNMKVGLFEVKPGFYQVRCFDLATGTCRGARVRSGYSRSSSKSDSRFCRAQGDRPPRWI
jgi:alkyl sulfatase BDS1-like metallo-beta-lactamase superfamily hydrolase